MTSIDSILSKIGYPNKYHDRIKKYPNKFINIDTNRMVIGKSGIFVSKKYHLASSDSALLKRVVQKLNRSPSPKRSLRSVKRSLRSPRKSPKKTPRKKSPKKRKSPKRKSLKEKIMEKYSPLKKKASSPKRAEAYDLEQLQNFVDSRLDSYSALPLYRYVLQDITYLTYLNVAHDGMPLTRRDYLDMITQKYEQVRRRDKRLLALNQSDRRFIREILHFLFSLVSLYQDRIYE